MKHLQKTKAALLTFSLATLMAAPGAHAGVTVVFNEDFESYPINTSPNAWTNGGAWNWIKGAQPTAYSYTMSRIFQSTTAGSGFNSKGWISNYTNQTIRASIPLTSLAGSDFADSYGNLKSGNLYVARFVVGVDSASARTNRVGFGITPSTGSLSYLGGSNYNGSVVFTNATMQNFSGEIWASGTALGKSDSRKFMVLFNGSGLSTDTVLTFDYRTIGSLVDNAAGAMQAYTIVDDISIEAVTGPPVLLDSPISTSKSTGESVTFSAAFTDATVYQWYKDDLAIEGATGSSYTIAYVTALDAGSYKVQGINVAGMTPSAAATLTVSDITPASVQSAGAILTYDRAWVTFSEPVTDESATNAANYAFSDSAVTITEVIKVDWKTFELATTPMTVGSTYTVLASNIVDYANHTSTFAGQASFTVVAPTSVSLYDAGDKNTTLSPPPPNSDAGGRWTIFRTVWPADPGITTNAVVDDDPTLHLNAWNIADTITTNGIVDYRMLYPSESHAFAKANGWRYKVRARLVDDYSSSGDLNMIYCDPAGRRYWISFDFAGIDLDLQVTLSGGAANGGFTTNLTLYGFTAGDYHTHEIVYDPLRGLATYIFDGTVITRDWKGDISTAYSGPSFGSGSTGNKGSMNYNQVEFAVPNVSSPVMVTNPASASVAYGSSNTLTGFASGFVAGYQWYKDGTAIPGATARNYTISSVVSTNSGQYQLKAFNSFTEVESTIATLTVLPTVDIIKTNGNFAVVFTGTLQSATNINAPFTDVSPTPTSPLILTDTATQPTLFFRTRE